MNNNFANLWRSFVCQFNLEFICLCEKLLTFKKVLHFISYDRISAFKTWSSSRFLLLFFLTFPPPKKIPFPQSSRTPPPSGAGGWWSTRKQQRGSPESGFFITWGQCMRRPDQRTIFLPLAHLNWNRSDYHVSNYRHSYCSPNWVIWTPPSALNRSLETLTCLIE